MNRPEKQAAPEDKSGARDNLTSDPKPTTFARHSALDALHPSDPVDLIEWLWRDCARRMGARRS